MRKWEQRVTTPPVRGGHYHASFSSALLDSIYRSIDVECARAKPTRGAPDPPPPSINPRWSPPSPVTRSRKHAAAAAVSRPRSTRYFRPATSSSSESSTCGGFSSSEPECAPAHPNWLKPIRTEKIRPANLPLPPKAREKRLKKNLRSIRSKLGSPTSPAARLAGFLNSLFSPKPPKAKEPACSFSKQAAEVASRNGSDPSVRFQHPVRGGNKESRYGRAVMTWRGVDDDEDDVASDTSSDLFELENLAAVGRYPDELPVFETTRVGGLVM